MNNKLFRQSALNELSSPEQVDEYVKVSSAPAFASLLAMLLFAVSLVVWGVAGHVTERVEIRGVVFPFDGVSEVTLPTDGVMRELYVKRGDYVRSGRQLALVSASGQFTSVSARQGGIVFSYKNRTQGFSAYEPVMTLLCQDSTRIGRELIAFTGFENLRKIKPGMQVQVSPTDLPREKHGYINGRVVGVESYPSTTEEILSTLRLEQFATNVLPATGAPYAIRILLDADPDTPGQLSWTHSRSARDQEVATGTFCNVQIVTKRQPIYKKMFEDIDNGVRTVKLWLD